MQAGHYRRALAFAAHTSGAHAEQTAGAALYAWLLAVGGQGAFAQRLLGEVAHRLPGDRLIQDLRQRLQPASALATGPGRSAAAATRRICTGGHEVFAHTSAKDGPSGEGVPRMPAPARVVASGLLIQQGQRAIAPVEALARRIAGLGCAMGWGETVSAQMSNNALKTSVIAMLALDSPLSDAPALTAPAADAFPGSQAHVVAYVEPTRPAPAWPWLHSGFLGPVDVGTGVRRLGVELPTGHRGGPVFDASGRLVGMALAQAGRADRLLPVSALHKKLGAALGTQTSPPAAPRMAMDEVYERALRLTLQVIAAPLAAASFARRLRVDQKLALT